MQTQRELVELHPNRGILNIDVQSFCVWHGGSLRKSGWIHTPFWRTPERICCCGVVASRQKNDLTVLDEIFASLAIFRRVKSIISELKQYDVSLEELDEQLRSGKKMHYLINYRIFETCMRDFRKNFRGKYITSEEILEELCYVVKI